MIELFGKNFFKNNRRNLSKSVGQGLPIIISANGLLQRNGDSTFAFRQDSNFWYLSGLGLPDFVLVIDGANEYLIAPNRTDYQNIFDGTNNVDDIFSLTGLKVFPNEQGWLKLKALLKKQGKAAAISNPISRVESQGFYTNPAKTELNQRLHGINPTLKITDLRVALAKMRVVKQPAELEAIKRAISITKETLGELAAKLASYKYEYEIEADITKGFRACGAMGHGFTPIVACGKNACTLHYTANNQKLNTGLVLLDVGAEYSLYSADISRTLAFGEPTKRQIDVFDAVADVQRFAVGLLKPGALLKDNEEKVINYMGIKLKQLGLIKTINPKTVRQYYKHSTSHYLGLDVHDVGDYSQPLLPGSVLTVEPGIYIDSEGIGVRIEDDVLITDKSTEVLSSNIPIKL